MVCDSNPIRKDIVSRKGYSLIIRLKPRCNPAKMPTTAIMMPIKLNIIPAEPACEFRP